MSKGPGWLQREILDTLEDAKNAKRSYRGSAFQENLAGSKTWRWDRAGWVWYRKHCVRLAERVYDLQASARYLATKHRRTQAGGQWQTETFQAAFSRSARGLVKRGTLIRLTLVPLAEFDGDAHTELIDLLADQTHYLHYYSPRTRFVKRYE